MPRAHRIDQYNGQVTDLTKTGKAKEVPLTAYIERALAERSSSLSASCFAT